MTKVKPALSAISATIFLAAVVVPWGAPALAQGGGSDAQSYAAGVKFGRTLFDARQCTGSGEYRRGCIDGVQESQSDREADKAMDSATGDPAADKSQHTPPPDLFPQSFSRPDDGSQPH
ncbi:MAG TPA: hypothetical protein VGM09_07880 [Bradyrhizobium sp.]|jgi:hypothetical protein